MRMAQIDPPLVEWLSRSLLTEAVQANRITTSIKNRTVNKIYYSGDDHEAAGWRSVEIFVYGRNQAGHDVVRAWLREGKSATPQGDGVDPLRNKPGWRLYRLDRISSFQNTNQKFTADQATCQARKYNPHDRHMSSIYYALEPEQGRGAGNVYAGEPTV